MSKGKTLVSKSLTFSDVEKLHVSLVEETLSDGSKAYNVYVMFPSRDEVVHYAESMEKAEVSFRKVVEALDPFIIY